MDDQLKELGFSSFTEWSKLVSNADISTPVKMAAFELWKNEDGTKEGLLALITDNQ